MFKSASLKLLFSVFALIFGVILYLFYYEPRYTGQISNTDKILVFAHRGFGNHAPDNSLIGAKLALDNQLDGVDVDAQFSLDREIVIFHDVSVERFTTGTGRVDDKTVKDLKAYDLAVKFGGGFSNVPIETFEEFVRAVVPRGLLMVELKVPGTGDSGIERRINEIIAKYDAYESIYVSSFNPFVLHRLKRTNSRIRTVFIFQDTGWDPKRVAETKHEDRVSIPWFLRSETPRVAIRKFIRPDALSINYRVDEATIDKLLAIGYPIFLWPVNDEQSIRWSLRKRPYALVTDEPLLAYELRENSPNRPRP